MEWVCGAKAHIPHPATYPLHLVKLCNTINTYSYVVLTLLNKRTEKGSKT